MPVITGFLISFGLGFVYFIGAIPPGVAAHAPLWVAALAAWCGYSAGGSVVLLAGAPLRVWILRRLRIDPSPDPSRLFWKSWHRFGVWGLGLIAPVTIGPQAGAALSLALGERPGRIQLALSLGAIPWAVAFSIFTSFGLRLWGH